MDLPKGSEPHAGSAAPGPILDPLDGDWADPSLHSYSEEAHVLATEDEHTEEECGASAEGEEEELHTGSAPGKDAPEATHLYTDSEPKISPSCPREDEHKDNLVNESPEPSSDS